MNTLSNQQTKTPINILFLCTGNSCRSQMAEGLAKHLLPNFIHPYSAGTHPTSVNPLAIQVMQEIGIPIHHHQSKNITQLSAITFHYIITVCNHAQENCPWIASDAKRIHHSFDDPPKLAESEPTLERQLVHYRRVRDEIKAFILTLPKTLQP